MENKSNKKAAKAGDMVKIQNSDSIIIGKAYSVKELNSKFSYNSLLLIENKITLENLLRDAIETGIKAFIDNVENVLNFKYSRAE